MRRNSSAKAFTLLEMLVVIMIIMMLATMITGVYIKEVDNARVATAASDIREMSLAAERYKLDVGRYPSTGSLLADGSGFGTGLFHSDVVYNVANLPNWKGPYLNIQMNKLDSQTSASVAEQVNIIDPWGMPYSFISSEKYGEANGGSKIQEGPFKDNFFNQAGVQIYSCGPNGVTEAGSARGLDEDDVTNFSM
ncbi:hypothetical protein GX645_02455 [Candidatus Sumerlaeota bacterium]|nr:hypothetical protein [Candidatus Sumerlaeota bacterium]